MKTRFFSIIVLVAGIVCSCSKKAPNFFGDGYVEPKDEIATLYPVSVTLDGATLRGSCYRQDVQFAERGFFFAIQSMDTNELAAEVAGAAEKFIDDKTDDGVFVKDVSDLVIGMRYYFIAYVKLSTGAYRFGEQMSFLPDRLDVLPADEPAAFVTPETYNSATVAIELGNFGTQNLIGLDVAMIQLNDVGIYLWKDGVESFADAQKISLNAGEATRLIKANATIDMRLRSLKGGTDYNVVPYLVIGVYRSYSSSITLMEEVRGQVFQFMTPPTPPPGVTSVAASGITTFSATINGIMTSDAGDPNPEMGFYLSNVEATLVSETNKHVVNLAEGGNNFSKYFSTLTSNTTYYFRTYIISGKGTEEEQTVMGAVLNFQTLFLAAPSITVTPMNYSYRITNVTTTGAVITCTVTAGIDPSMTVYGIKWSTNSGDLSNDASGSNLDEQTGVFTITLGLLSPQTTYYFKPYATNGAGDCTYLTVESFRTATDGGKEWLYNPTISTGLPMYDRMSQTLAACIDLVYYELDPIVSGTTTYYLLDRNLGARERPLLSDIGLRISNAEPDEALRQRVGSYYQWGIDKPSVTWQMPAAANLTNDPNNFYWLQGTPQNFDTWQVNPCPAGYDIPTKAELLDMVAIGKGASAEANLTTLFNTMRFGPTAFCSANNGGRNNNDTWSATIWTKDVTNASGALDCFKVHRAVDGIPAGVTNGAPPRASSATIRCVRVVTTP